MATALGCLPSAIDDEPVINILELLEYWIEEPPAHVILALRYLGQRKKGPRAGQRQQTEEEFTASMGELTSMIGRQAQPVSQKTRDLVAYAEEMKANMQKGKKRGQ